MIRFSQQDVDGVKARYWPNLPLTLGAMAKLVRDNYDLIYENPDVESENQILTKYTLFALCILGHREYVSDEPTYKVIER